MPNNIYIYNLEVFHLGKNAANEIQCNTETFIFTASVEKSDYSYK